MAEFTASYSALNRPSETYDGRGYRDVGYELEDTSSAPTQTSVFRSHNDSESLVKQSRASSHANTVEIGSKQSFAVDRTATAISRREKRRKLQGWRFGVAASTAMATAVLVTNTVLAIWASVKFQVVGGIGTAYEGDCDVVNRWALWLHILINVLSSLLLSASNYSMQCLSSPTRKDCDTAHKAGDWCDIGVAGVRNLSRINRQRTALWVLLGLSSIPIHLLYNSAVFKSIGANNYLGIFANEKFLEGGNYTLNYTGTLPMDPSMSDFMSTVREAYLAEPSAWESLDRAACITTYGTAFVSTHSDVIVITKDTGYTANNTVFATTYVYAIEDGNSGGAPPYDWICMGMNNLYGNSCNTAEARRNADSWMMEGKKVDHCLSRKTEPHCKLQFSIAILIAVIICNLIKSLSMFWTLQRQRVPTLVTVGDAIASYLDHPDELTRGRCLTAKADIDRGPLRWRRARELPRPTLEPPVLLMKYAPKVYDFLSQMHLGNVLVYDTPSKPSPTPPATAYSTTTPGRWFSSVSYKRWLSTIGLCTVTLLITGYLLHKAVDELIQDSGGNTITSLGFGAVDSRAIIRLDLPQDGASGLASSVLLANLPQAILSFLYVMYNGLYTCMHLSHEYSKYAVRRKPLRVTTPYGEQRSTYYLQLPFTYGVPLLVISATLHWLVSESIFLARVSVYDSDSPAAAEEVSAVGYSCAPIVAIIVLGSVMLFVAVGMGFRRFASNMPIAGSCSVAIAAACHRPKEEDDAAVLPVMWGDVGNTEGQDGEVGHCCFSSEEVAEPVLGRLYAGVQEGGESTRIHRRINRYS